MFADQENKLQTMCGPLLALYHSVVLGGVPVRPYGLGFTTMPQTNLLKLDRVQNEATRVILGTTKDTPTSPPQWGTAD